MTLEQVAPDFGGRIEAVVRGQRWVFAHRVAGQQEVFETVGRNRMLGEVELAARACGVIREG